MIYPETLILVAEPWLLLLYFTFAGCQLQLTLNPTALGQDAEITKCLKGLELRVCSVYKNIPIEQEIGDRKQRKHRLKMTSKGRTLV